VPEDDGKLKPVAAKLAPPRVDDAFLRPETLAAIERGRSSRLTLVCAPAGYGKTTAIAAACQRAGVEPIWYKLGVTARVEAILKYQEASANAHGEAGKLNPVPSTSGARA
jgi:ATP/maltotriose-dependent transcriptional regulator MalT